MKEVYWKEQGIILNIEKINKQVMFKFKASSYKEFLSKLHYIYHNKKEQTFLCPDCKKAIYTIVKTEEDSFHFRNYKNSHKSNCKVHPKNSLSIYLSNQISEGIQLEIKDSEIVLDYSNFIKSGEESDFIKIAALKSNFELLHYLFNYYISNINRFYHDNTIKNEYKKIILKFSSEKIEAKDLFLDTYQAIQYFNKMSDSDINSNNNKIKFDSKYIYGKILGIYPAKFNTYNVLISSLDEKKNKINLYLQLTKEQLQEMFIIYHNIKRENKIMFYGYPIYKTKQAIYFKTFNKKYVSLVNHYFSNDGYFLDSFNKMIITNYLTFNNYEYYIPTRTVGNRYPYTLDKCKKIFSDDKNAFYIPDWIIIDKNRNKPIIFNLLNKNIKSDFDNNGEFVQNNDERLKFFKSLKDYEAITLYKDDINSAIFSENKEVTYVINELMNSLLKKY